MKNFAIYFLTFVLLTCFACSSPEESTDCEDSILVELKDMTGLDGCTWVFTSMQVDFAMEPINLLDFLDQPQDGAQFEITFVERTDLASICLVGRIIEITCLQ